MALLFMDGFAHYATADIGKKYNKVATPAGTSVAVGSAYGRAGGCGMRFTGVSYVAKAIPRTPSTGLIIGFALRVDSGFFSAGNSGFYTILSDSGSSLNSAIAITSSGAIGISASAVNSPFYSGPGVVPSGQWCYVEVKTRLGAPVADNEYQVKVNGNLAASVTGGGSPAFFGVSSSYVTTSIGFCGGSSSNNNTGFMFDIADLYILSRDAGANGSFIGNKVVQTIYPASAGSASDFAVVGSSALAAVSDNPPDGDTSYISSSTTGNKSTFIMGGLSGTPTISGVQFNELSRKEGVGTGILAPYFKLGGVEYLNSAWGRFPSYIYIPNPKDNNPATGAAWLASEVSGIEVGVKILT